MTTTCRLLCALLVLALCCCPSVFATEEEDNRSKDSAAQENISGKNGEQNGTDGSSPLTSKKSAKENENGTQEIQGDKGTTGLQSDTNKSADETDQDAEASAQTTTTTTTKAPTTTTTTTTHAPSRLREVDGSLSSSAWVCAPLLLAASALAYTAVG
ncbi:mucin TcMUCII [Trypanosoma cruzi cruzi]|uniref:Putative mucin TcMUCII n=1 Tax=Trypanosoma cruzi TaxID=5693 RepID=A0A2V2USK1_TRYCR|nr:mucin TcMUCII [Trypanosoma cruzi cruzi]PWU86132.1 putative mucin TcMUCII [Trypanosoma cruzi]